jgi:hypothetical protein
VTLRICKRDAQCIHTENVHGWITSWNKGKIEGLYGDNDVTHGITFGTSIVSNRPATGMSVANRRSLSSPTSPCRRRDRRALDQVDAGTRRQREQLAPMAGSGPPPGHCRLPCPQRAQLAGSAELKPVSLRVSLVIEPDVTWMSATPFFDAYSIAPLG